MVWIEVINFARYLTILEKYENNSFLDKIEY